MYFDAMERWAVERGGVWGLDGGKEGRREGQECAVDGCVLYFTLPYLTLPSRTIGGVPLVHFSLKMERKERTMGSE